MLGARTRACFVLPSCQRPTSSCSLDFFPPVVCTVLLDCCTFKFWYRFCSPMVRSRVNGLKRVSTPCTVAYLLVLVLISMVRGKPRAPSRSRVFVRVLVVPLATRMTAGPEVFLVCSPAALGTAVPPPNPAPSPIGDMFLRVNTMVFVLRLLRLTGGEGTHRASGIQRPSPERALQEVPA